MGHGRGVCDGGDHYSLPIKVSLDRKGANTM